MYGTRVRVFPRLGLAWITAATFNQPRPRRRRRRSLSRPPLAPLFTLICRLFTHG